MIDLEKAKEIINMTPLRSYTHLHCIHVYVAYLRCFISNLSGRCIPIPALGKMDANFEWNEHFQYVFEDIK